ncbi:MAG: hypothetical protein GAK29_00899 [Acinetobacter bereziniae]|uniref:Restriction alleviation protein, Lar family n=1 Tax=Acinetobacter bereziniae TaxID=106648 RepID=A0A833PHB8_ACIBZ|nr:MAG: hypothetical protein GAK29_00899 [Acinetobacter bereziniae]
MENRWHADQENDMRPDVKALPCPWCGYDHGVVVDTEMHEGEHLNTWTAQASCHECGAASPNSDIGPFPHPLKDDYDQVDWENEHEVVNFAVKVWNCRA